VQVDGEVDAILAALHRRKNLPGNGRMEPVSFIVHPADAFASGGTAPRASMPETVGKYNRQHRAEAPAAGLGPSQLPVLGPATCFPAVA
jgi:hypothetical protein